VPVWTAAGIRGALARLDPYTENDRVTRPQRPRTPRVVRGTPSVQLTRVEFLRRFRARFYDPLYEAVTDDLDRVGEVAWQTYRDYHKSPRTKPGGRAFEDPRFELPIEWLATRAAIRAAERVQRRARSPSRFLLVNGSSRSDHTCPGEMSKTYRLAKIAQHVIEKERRAEVDFLDLSHVASEFGRQIHPCKACVSTAMPLCNWPCSCYPNHALGQVQDWMNDI
jgi:hypothetical protein